MLRTFRNRRFFIFSLAFPLVILLAIGSANRHAKVETVSLLLYYMTGMAAFGSMMAVISSGAPIATERQLGWTRRLRVTPLRARTYFEGKVLTGYMMAILTGDPHDRRPLRRRIGIGSAT